ncbi:nucleoside phosphatase family-domain-containing protein [Suillus subalutaceus]|uniref:nucleoside phosphatase family-domain-containing protein n=1 Tax=Suillus subalutaceus TaxID=48586 RepID=UPI001B86D56C|nr:nucleoside phosphatase family-domain-containing protein [Suillus subalutaceus]KAG1860148.1 nucleoside phosphatase family-domain-containing protein [Suillus subalutaceus]
MFFTSTSSSSYERLEGGFGPGRTARMLAWKKFAIGAVVLISVVWLFGPRSSIDLIPDSSLPGMDPPVVHTPTKTTPSNPSEDEIDIHKTTATSPPSQTSFPTSPETDPDLLKTVHCTSPHSPTLPLVQYALMIDAGSTGSRIHIYKFHNCGPSPTFEYEVFRMIQPGLSSHAGFPTAAAESLDLLLDEAMTVVPESLQSCTPVAVKATAGLRLLGAHQSDSILTAVHDHILSKYPFPFPDKDGVVIMDGKDEGVYAWITANYLLNTIRGDSPKDAPPYAVLDLGGGSTQIVFEPQFGDEKSDNGLKEGEHKYELEFGGAKRVLYQHSYLGYGLKSARESVHRVVQFMDSLRSSKDGANDRMRMVHNPCLAQGSVKRDGDTVTVTMTGSDVGSFEACNRILELVMAKDDVCELKPCSFNGVYQPSLLDAFPNGKILLLSYFFDRITPLLLADSSPDHPQPPMSISTFATLAKQVCAGPTSWEQHWGAYPDIMEELEGRPEWCLDLSFQHALLVLGYEFGDDREVQLGKRIEGTELGWCLGATIAMVGGNLRCRV